MKLFFSALVMFVMIYPVQAKTINVVTEEMPPFNFTENGVMKGFSSEVVMTVLKKAGFKSNFKSYPWKRAYKIALRSPDTLIYSIGRNPDRENKFKWVGVIAPVNIYFYKLKSRQDILAKSLGDAIKYNTGVVHEDYTTQFLISKKFKNLDMASSYVLTVRKLFERRVDIILIDELTLASLIRKESASGSSYALSDVEKVMFIEEISSGMYMAFSLETNDSIVEKCKKALDDIKINGVFNAIMKKYKR